MASHLPEDNYYDNDQPKLFYTSQEYSSGRDESFLLRMLGGLILTLTAGIGVWFLVGRVIH